MQTPPISPAPPTPPTPPTPFAQIAPDGSDDPGEPEKKEIIAEPQTAVRISQLEEIESQVSEAVRNDSALSFNYDEKEGNKLARSHLFSLRKTRAVVESARKAAKAYALNYGRKVDEVAAKIREPLEAAILRHEEPIDKIDAIKKAESDRLEKMLSDLKELLTAKSGESLAEITNRINKIEKIDYASYGIMEIIASALVEQNRAELRSALERAKEQHVHALELIELRKQAAEQVKKEEQAALEEKAKKEVEQRIAKEQAAKEQAEKEKGAAKEAEQKSIAEQREREKRQAIEREQKAISDRLAAEKAKQEAEAELIKMRAAESERLLREATERAKEIIRQADERVRIETAKVIAENKRFELRETHIKQLGDILETHSADLPGLSRDIVDGLIPSLNFTPDQTEASK